MFDSSSTSNASGLIQVQDPADSSSVWSIPLLCIAIAVIACCVLVPAADDNRSLAIENMHLQADLTQINKQIGINDQFLKSIANNPTLLERLAERQMKLVHSGESVLKMHESQSPADAQMSPFFLLNLPPPAMAIAPPSPRSQLFTQLADRPRIRLFAMGGALLLMATALVLGAAPKPPQN